MIKKKLKELRRYIITKICTRNCRVNKLVYVNNFSKFTRNTTIGTNCHFNGVDIRGGGKVSIGDNFHSGTDLLIITDNHNYNGSKLPYDDTKIIKDVTIGDNVWIGSRVTILGGVDIGEGAIIQAGSVVVRNIEPLSIVGGNPAVKFKERDRTHYFELKKSKMFN